MKKSILAWVAGGLIAVSALGVAFSAAVSNAAAGKDRESPPAQQGTMMQGGQAGNMDPKAMAEMMQSPQMQQQCIDMMKTPEMQQAMKDMMKTPEMQGIMKQMLAEDAAFHQMMSDLVNSVDLNAAHGGMDATPSGASPSSDHNAHHKSDGR